MTTAAIRIYTAIVALICTAALAFAIHSQNASASWRSELAYWRDVSDRSSRHDRTTARRLRRLSHRYNRLVRVTRRSERQLLAALAQARSSGGAAAVPGTVYHQVSVSAAVGGGGGSPAPQPTGAPAPTPVPPPTTRTS